MNHATCRHYSAERDTCTLLTIISPRVTCTTCKSYEPTGHGLGDVVERVIDTVTMGLAKKATKKAGGCGCQKRRAALNRLTDKSDK